MSSQFYPFVCIKQNFLIRDSTTAVGGPRQKLYQRNPIYEVTIPCTSEFRYVNFKVIFSNTHIYNKPQRPSAAHRPRSWCIHEHLPLPVPKRESTEVHRFLRAVLGCPLRRGHLQAADSGGKVLSRAIDVPCGRVRSV